MIKAKTAMRNGRLKQLMLGVLLALLICPAQTAQAQWAVYDGANHATQLQRMAQDLQRWLETVQHYMQEIEHYNRMFDNAVQQVTSLGGILTTVDEQLARNRRLIGTISSVGQTIRNLHQLERQIYNMVTSRIRAVQNVWMRLKDGIFDPAQNMRDLEEYLKYSIGRPSEEAVARIELLANQDAEFEQYLYLRELAYGRLANAERQVRELEAQLAAEMQKPEGERQGVAELEMRLILNFSNSRPRGSTSANSSPASAGCSHAASKLKTFRASAHFPPVPSSEMLSPKSSMSL